MWGTLCEGGSGKEWIELKAILKANSVGIETFQKQGLVSLLKKPWSLREGIRHLAQRLNLKVSDKMLEKAYKSWWGLVLKSQPYPETIDVLKRLKQKQLRLVIISNTDSESFYFEMNRFNLHKYFEKFFLSAEIGVLKPNVKIFEAVQAYLTVPKSQVLMIDDSLYHGVLSVRKFGWQALWVARGKDGKDKARIEDLKGIFDFL